MFKDPTPDTPDVESRHIYALTWSGSIRGKYADAMPSTEELIKDKQEEAELEDRPS